ncbi:M15 family metallopeptidase [Reinekea marina]|uniref:D-alanyl-D-alanine carboxypeptidase family protein n=1 Tax=Reinekea marina TaxID=1310421 RepID=A0ABV7WM17_9GAMM|nr:M15 family metallopeptidase [Reinekea marina]MDN3649898.1 M15 family metallopeptidase [Reinekea marina]
MKRREFLIQSVSASAVIAGAGYASLDMLSRRHLRYEQTIEQRGTHAAAKVMVENNPTMDEGLVSPSAPQSGIDLPSPEKAQSRPALSYLQQDQAEKLMPDLTRPDSELNIVEEVVLPDTNIENIALATPEESAETVQEKVSNFETNFTDDVVLSEADYKLLVQSLERINRVQDYVGFGNFNVLSLDEALKYAKYSPRIGEFSAEELNFLEKMFNYNSSRLGFFGEKVISNMTNVVPSNDVVKMPGTGHYVFRGHSETFYNKLTAEVGDTLILTSGVRNIVKQYQLFMAKTVQASGNLSRASRSLAPPGHSYHAIGDFDVGRVGGGLANFTAEFASTEEFKKLQDLGYVQIRYTADNTLGVRYEPWHIRVV